MPERATGGDAVADELFDLLDFRKAAPLLPRPDDLIINAHLKDATGPIRGSRSRAPRQRGQQLLRHPARPQAPAAQSTIGDLDHGADGHSCLRVRCVGALVSTSRDDENSPARRFYRLTNVRFGTLPSARATLQDIELASLGQKVLDDFTTYRPPEGTGPDAITRVNS
jgi:hypothetical protein